jgi:hypothetical protein
MVEIVFLDNGFAQAGKPARRTGRMPVFRPQAEML